MIENDYIPEGAYQLPAECLQEDYEKEMRIAMLLKNGMGGGLDSSLKSERYHDVEPSQREDCSESPAWLIAKKTASRALDTNGNSVYSPACIAEGLRVLRLGASGDTAHDLDGIVGGAFQKGDDLGLSCEAGRFCDGYVGRILSGVWLDKAAKPERSFVDACKREDVVLARTDLSLPDAEAEITRWVSDATDGFIAPGIKLNSRALACVVSVLYFKDAWEKGFPKESTERKPFHAPEGDINADYLVNTRHLDMMDGEFGTFVSLPLSSGASMVLFLPREESLLGDVLRDGSIFDCAAGLKMEKALVELRLPKFSCDTAVDNMIEVLSEAGFSTARNPDLTPMTGSSATPATFAHGTKISVDEDGLEAGSYFAMVACTGAPCFDEMPEKPRMITFDRPFLFFVVSRFGQPLFVGTVAKPEADAFAWLPLDSGEEKVSENGWIVKDEEIPGKCRITLEEDCPVAPYSITWGVYGLIVHTTWANDYQEAMAKYEGLKRVLKECVESLEDDSFDSGGWCERLVSEW